MQNQFEESGSKNGLITFNDVIALFIRWKKQLMIIGLSAIVLSAALSFLITPKYKASVIFYPTTNNSISNALLTDLNQRQKDPLEFGEEEEAEKALQILQSSKLTEKLVKNFNLMKHYKIDENAPLKYTKLQNKIDDNISYSRTRYLSIRIDVMDEDPNTAAKMANGIADLYDTVKNEIQQEVAVPALAILRRALDAKQNEVKSLKDQLKSIGEKGVTNYLEESRAISEALYKVNDAKQREALLQQQKTLVQFGGENATLLLTLAEEVIKLSNLQQKYEKAEVDVKETLNNKFTVSSASAAEQRSYPVRKLIVLIALITSLAAASIFFAIYEKIKGIKQ